MSDTSHHTGDRKRGVATASARQSSLPGNLVTVLQLAVVAWGAFAFGCVYPSGLWPLVAGCVVVGVAAAFLGQRHDSDGSLRRLSFLLAAIAIFIAIQLVPLPRALLVTASPARDLFLERFDLAYANPEATASTWHPLSVNPSSTRLALACLAAFAVFLLGSARGLSARRSALLARGVAVIGVALALVGIVQNMMSPARIYGIWAHPYENRPFGPFVNKNNFAGWMLMALPLVVMYAYGTAAAGLASTRKDWRSRVLWLETRAGSETVLCACAAFVMGVSLFMSMSRSGIAAFVVAMGLAIPLAVRRRGARRALGLGVVLLVVVLFASIGVGQVARRFNTDTEASLQGRVWAWQDALAIFVRYPVAGTGLNTFRSAMLLYQQHDPDNYWSEAHNDYLQLLAEGGVGVAALGLVTVLVFVRATRRRLREESERDLSYWIRLGALSGLFAIALQETVEFSLQIPGNACLFALLAAIALRQPAARSLRGERESSPRGA